MFGPSARTLAFALAAALLLLTACSGGDPEPLAPVTPAAPTTSRAPQARPNLLVIETDDMRTDELRWMPNTRRLLRARGLSFENSFAPYPLCCPSRASTLTGEYTHNHRVFTHEDPFGFQVFDDTDTLATRLQAAGYRTALIGKYLNGYGEQPIRGTTRSSLHYVPPGWDQWLAGSDHLWQPGETTQGGTYDYFRLTQNHNGKIVSWPGNYSTDVLARQTRETIARFGRSKRPWFVWWNPVAPHHGTPIEVDDPDTHMPRDDGNHTDWVTPARPDWVKGLFDDEISHGLGVPPKGEEEKDVSDKPRWIRGTPPLNSDEREAVTTVTRQRAESLYVLDRRIGELISTLSRNGQLKQTLIVFTSDNGYYLGEHRKRQGKINLHEPSLRVPLIIAGPGVPVGRRYDPVTTVDLPVTLASYAGTQLRSPDGMDLRGLITDGDTGWNRPVVTEGLMPEERYRRHRDLSPGCPLNTRGLRLGRWKFTRYSVRSETELYDLQNDPLELRSLHRDPAYAGIRRSMRALYDQYSDCAGEECLAPLPPDFRLTPEESKALTIAQQRATREYYGG